MNDIIIDMTSAFASKVHGVVRSIKRGDTLTYKEVAELAGSPRAYRAVGNILNRNRDPEIPCHRVIKSDGSYGGYNKGQEAKKRILDNEKHSKPKLSNI